MKTPNLNNPYLFKQPTQNLQSESRNVICVNLVTFYKHTKSSADGQLRQVAVFLQCVSFWGQEWHQKGKFSNTLMWVWLKEKVEVGKLWHCGLVRGSHSFRETGQWLEIVDDCTTALFLVSELLQAFSLVFRVNWAISSANLTPDVLCSPRHGRKIFKSNLISDVCEQLNTEGDCNDIWINCMLKGIFCLCLGKCTVIIHFSVGVVHSLSIFIWKLWFIIKFWKQSGNGKIQSHVLRKVIKVNRCGKSFQQWINHVINGKKKCTLWVITDRVSMAAPGSLHNSLCPAKPATNDICSVTAKHNSSLVALLYYSQMHFFCVCMKYNWNLLTLDQTNSY